MPHASEVAEGGKVGHQVYLRLFLLSVVNAYMKVESGRSIVGAGRSKDGK